MVADAPRIPTSLRYRGRGLIAAAEARLETRERAAGMILSAVRDPLLGARPSPIAEGGTAPMPCEQPRSRAQHAEALDYRRYWLAEHHNMPGIASAATAAVIAHVASGPDAYPRRCRRRHAASTRLVIAEQFGTLESLFPAGSIWASAGVGTDQRTARALAQPRRQRPEFSGGCRRTAGLFPRAPAPGRIQMGQAVHAVPGAGLDIPIWLLAPACSARNWRRRWPALRLRPAFRPDYLMVAPNSIARPLSPRQVWLSLCDGGDQRLCRRHG